MHDKYKLLPPFRKKNPIPISPLLKAEIDLILTLFIFWEMAPSFENLISSIFKPRKFSQKMTSVNFFAHFLPILMKKIFTTFLKLQITLIQEAFD